MPTSAIFGGEIKFGFENNSFSKYNQLVFAGQMSLKIIAELLKNTPSLLKRFPKPRLEWKQCLPN